MGGINPNEHVLPANEIYAGRSLSQWMAEYWSTYLFRAWSEFSSTGKPVDPNHHQNDRLIFLGTSIAQLGYGKSFNIFNTSHVVDVPSGALLGVSPLAFEADDKQGDGATHFERKAIVSGLALGPGATKTVKVNGQEISISVINDHYCETDQFTIPLPAYTLQSAATHNPYYQKYYYASGSHEIDKYLAATEADAAAAGYFLILHLDPGDYNIELKGVASGQTYEGSYTVKVSGKSYG